MTETERERSERGQACCVANVTGYDREHAILRDLISGVCLDGTYTCGIIGIILQCSGVLGEWFEELDTW